MSVLIIYTIYYPINRLSSYHKDYLKVLPDVKVRSHDTSSAHMIHQQGAQQVVRWPATKVSEWLQSIELGNYCDHLEGVGLHGAIMVSHAHDLYLLATPTRYWMSHLMMRV